MDEILASLTPHLLEFHNKNYGTNHIPSDITNYNLENFWDCNREEAVRRVREFYKSSEFGLIVPVEGAVEGVNRLNHVNDLVVITSRPDQTKERSMDWINRFYPGKFTDVHFSNEWHSNGGRDKKKSEICHELGVDVMIEDCLGYAVDCSQAGIPVVLLDLHRKYGWNHTDQDPSGVERVYDWSGIVERVKQLKK